MEHPDYGLVLVSTLKPEYIDAHHRWRQRSASLPQRLARLLGGEDSLPTNEVAVNIQRLGAAVGAIGAQKRLGLPFSSSEQQERFIAELCDLITTNGNGTFSVVATGTSFQGLSTNPNKPDDWMFGAGPLDLDLPGLDRTAPWIAKFEDAWASQLRATYERECAVHIALMNCHTISEPEILLGSPFELVRVVDGVRRPTTSGTMLLAHHPELIDTLRAPTAAEPWRVLVSGCLAGWLCGVNGDDYGLGATLADLRKLPTFCALPFCPEQHGLGTPRTMPDIHGGDGFDVVAGRAKVFDEHGEDLTARILDGARAMLEFGQLSRAELAIVTDMSAACGSQVISDGCRLVEPRRYQKGVGVATALLLEAGIPVVSQRDFRTLALLRARLESGHQAPADARDHHEHPWTVENLPERHPRA